MLKSVTALFAALTIGGAVMLAPTAADAKRCGGCGPIKPSYSYKTKVVHKHVKRYKDVYRTKYVQRIKRHYHVTRIQPVIHVKNIKRVHTRIVGVVKPVHIRVTKYLPAKRYVTNSVVHLRPTCGCRRY